MEIRIYKDGAKTGKTGKLVVAGVIIAGVMALSAYALMEWHLPFLEVEPFVIAAIFSTGIFTFGKFKGLPLWQFIFLAFKFRLTVNHRIYKVERNNDGSKANHEKTKKTKNARSRSWRKTKG
ncbi:hypothetical protein [Lactococcus lactis]|uniref:hypothetical protein n=1 Tax=Lactococcus lactis TaxID=1358 RepID=UPI0018C6600A|nr:hypothetical protein [Lactococcus lactis]MBG1279311.1 hypothetical protein [Lactococcus lactis subsp. lactis]